MFSCHHKEPSLFFLIHMLKSILPSTYKITGMWLWQFWLLLLKTSSCACFCHLQACKFALSSINLLIINHIKILASKDHSFLSYTQILRGCIYVGVVFVHFVAYVHEYRVLWMGCYRMHFCPMFFCCNTWYNVTVPNLASRSLI